MKCHLSCGKYGSLCQHALQKPRRHHCNPISRSLKKVRGFGSAPGSPSLHRSRAPYEGMAPPIAAHELRSGEPRRLPGVHLASFFSDLRGTGKTGKA
jgi:hypothetical protein